MTQRAHQTSFSQSRAARDRFCRGKDRVLVPILERLEIGNPADFRAVLMPSLYGIEARFLVAKGVPASNIFAIENNSAEYNFDVHDEIAHCRLLDRQEMRGMRTTERPAGVRDGLNAAWFEFGERQFSFIYLDFLSQPDFDLHFWGCLRKIVKGHMLRPRGVLLLNFGRSRCRQETAVFNHDLTAHAAELRGTRSDTENAKVLVEAAAEEWGGRLSAPITTWSYRSRTQTYTTTMAVF